jgi:hypothetical protein
MDIVSRFGGARRVAASVVRFLLLAVLMLPACSRHGACSEVEVAIAAEPSHSLKLPADEVRKATGGTYRMRGSDHDHALLLTDENMKKLALGAPVTVRTSSTNAHLHEATLRCKR